MKKGQFHFALATIGRGSIKRPKRKKLTSPVKTVGYDRGGRVTVHTLDGPIVCYYRKREPELLRMEDFGMPGFTAEDAWNMAEQVETRKDAQLAYRIIVAGSIELTDEQNWAVYREFAHEVHNRLHALVSLTGHNKPGNPHAHMIVGQRRVRVVDGMLSFDRKKFDDLNPYVNKNTEGIEALRQLYANMLNKALEAAKQEVRVDHRSFRERDIDLIPTKHEGPKSRRLAEKHGILSGATKQNREIANANQAIREIRAAIAAKTKRRKDLVAVRDMPAALRAALVDGIRARAEDADIRSRAAKRRAREAELRERAAAEIELEISRTEQALAHRGSVVRDVVDVVATPTAPTPETKIVGSRAFHDYLVKTLREIGEYAPADARPENFRFLLLDGIPTALFFLNLGKGNRIIQIASYRHLRTAAEAAAATKECLDARSLTFDDQLHEGDLKELLAAKDLPLALGNQPKPGQELDH